MKQKIKVSLLGLSIGSAMFLSCQKKDVTPAPTQANQSTVTANNSNGTTGPVRGPRPRLYYNGDGWCHSGMEVNCVKLPEIVVSPNRIAALIGLDGESSSDVATLFNNTDWDDFNAELPDEYLTALQSGDYYLGISNESSEKVCFIAGPSSPVTSENMSFALQMDKTE
ncbi:MAG: hypothetical protein K0S32_4324 [Bacteroidetes bacterium]|jgi:hypothetical protein|nr:hypothetical protein [Bacteroidota bacterium]